MKSPCLARPLAVVALMILLTFSQFVAAAYACANALSSLPVATATMTGMSDCTEMQSHAQPLVCKAHCEKDAQAEAHKSPALPLPDLFTLFYLAPLTDHYLSALQPPSSPVFLALSPPARILFQVFRN